MNLRNNTIQRATLKVCQEKGLMLENRFRLSRTEHLEVFVANSGLIKASLSILGSTIYCESRAS